MQKMHIAFSDKPIVLFSLDTCRTTSSEKLRLEGATLDTRNRDVSSAAG
jgi:hypothetical protein